MRPKTKGSCPTGKRRYADGYTAQLALDIVQRERRSYGKTDDEIERRIYECRCGGWHLTSHEEDGAPPRRDAAEVLKPF